MVDWEKLKTEYITTRCSYRELSEKYGVSYGTLKIHARCDRWVEEREKHFRRTVEKSLDIIGDRQAEDLAKVDHMADQMLEKLQQAIEELDLAVIQHKEKGESDSCKWEKTYVETVPGGIVDRQGLQKLAACLKDLKQIKDIQTELEKLEQELKIQKLREEAEGEDAQGVLVTMEKDVVPFSS